MSGNRFNDVRLISVGFSRVAILALTEAKVPDLSLAKGVPLFEAKSGI